MALRLNDATAIINRLTNLVPATSDYCCGFYFKPSFSVSPPFYIAPHVITNVAYDRWAGIFGNDAGFPGSNSFIEDIRSSVGTISVGSPFIPIDTLFHLAYRRSGTTHFLYTNALLEGQVTNDISLVTFFEMLLGNDRFSTFAGTIDIFDFFEYNTAKSQNLISFQMGIIGRPVNTENLVAFTPLLNDLNDISGNNNHWLGAGNFEFVANPLSPGIGQIFEFDSLNLDPDAFSLQDMQSVQYSDVPVGSGYSIIEQIPAGWNTPTYQISNGSPNTNISVADGETVTVVVRNSLVGPPLANVTSGIYKLVPGKRNDTLWLEGFTGTRDVKIP